LTDFEIRILKSPAPWGGDFYFLTVNGNGIRAISRILGISRSKVSSTLRGFEPELWRANHACLESLAGNPP